MQEKKEGSRRKRRREKYGREIQKIKQDESDSMRMRKE